MSVQNISDSPPDDFLGSPDSEVALIGSILINDDAYSEASIYIETPLAFSVVKHRIVWEAMTNVKYRNDPIDMVTLADELTNMGKLDYIGGYAQLMKFTENVVTSQYVPVYAEMVERFYTRRKLVDAGENLKKLAYDKVLNIEQVRDEAENSVSGVWSDNSNQFGGWAKDIMSARYDEFERMLKEGKTLPGVPTGITPLDNIMLGFERAQLSIFAGRPGMGKTSTFVSILLNRCLSGEFVLMFSSEMSKEQVMDRLWSMQSGIPVKKLKTPRKMTRKELEIATKAFGKVSEFKLYIDDTPNPRPRHVKSVTKMFRARYNIEYILVDGIYTMTPNYDLGSRTLNVGSISKDLREIARTFNIHVATTHQLNRSVESRQDKRPVLSDLRDSGELEQDADKVIFLYRDEVYNAATEYVNQIDFIVAKHRDGETGIASAYFKKEIMRVMDGTVTRVDLTDLE